MPVLVGLKREWRLGDGGEVSVAFHPAVCGQIWRREADIKEQIVAENGPCHASNTIQLFFHNT